MDGDGTRSRTKVHLAERRARSDVGRRSSYRCPWYEHHQPGHADAHLARLDDADHPSLLRSSVTPLRAVGGRIVETAKREGPPVSTRAADVRSHIAHQRLAGLLLTSSKLETAADVVRRLGAVQAQDYAGAKWAVAMRTRRLVLDAAVEQAVADGAILRTHV